MGCTMAARQDQTLQIFLIVFIFAFLVSAVLAYLGWHGYSEASAREAAVTASKKDADDKLRTKDTELQELHQYVGFGPNDNAAAVKAAFDADMKTYGGGIADEASRTYRKVVETVYTERDQTAAREAKLKQQVSDQAKALLAVEANAKAQMDKYDEARKKAVEDLANQQSAFADYRKTLEDGQKALQKSLDDQRAKYEGQIAEREAKVKDLEGHVAKLDRANRYLLEQRKDEPGSFEVADGRVSLVNQNGTVWINLGAADALRRQVVFSVFDADQHDAAKATKKGSIEVVRLLGDHMAEARITKDEPSNPILPGDNIYSQVWHRGKKLHFALTGLIDVDGDGQSDLQLVRELIKQNGGIVDAYLGDDGKVDGEITANTRFLILGDVPKATSKTGMEQGYHEMSKTAASLGVQTVQLAQFIDQMGYKPPDRTVRLGTGAEARDFPARAENNTGSNGTTPGYHPRSNALPTTTSPRSQ
jgi:hypothetical protein